MSRLVDTSVIVRYLTGQPPLLAARAAEILDGDPDIAVTPLVLAETSHVLASVYHIPREARIDCLVSFVQKKNLSVCSLEKAMVCRALLLCRPSGRVSVPDALTWAAAHASPERLVYSFDERFPTDGIAMRDSLIHSRAGDA